MRFFSVERHGHTEFILKAAPPDIPETEPFDLERIVADMIFSLNGVAYHIEFENKADRTGAE